MIRLGIIDDEHQTRKGLRSMLDWRALGIEIVGEAEDGLSGKAMILNAQPDIIICDVRMPRLDGIALVAQVRPLRPDLEIIFLSGHSEKAYLKSAIRFGAVDYLDKPVQAAELSEVVDKAVARVRDGRSVSPARALEVHMAQLLLGKEAGASALPGGLPVDFDRPYMLAVCSFGFTEREEEAAHLFGQQQLGPFARQLAACFSGKALMHPLGAQYVGYFEVPDGFDVGDLARAFEAAMPDAWRHTALAVSRVHESARDIPIAYQEAIEANLSFLGGYGRAYAPDRQGEPAPYEAYAGAIDKIIAHVEAHEFTRAAQTLGDYVARARRAAFLSIAQIKKDLARLAVFFSVKLHGSNDAYQFAALERVKFGCLTLGDVEHYLKDQLGSIVSSFDSLTSKGRVIYDVERYIEANYFKDLSIADIASQVYLTPTYLCYLYKKNTGKTINAYMTEVKMNKAKELLKNPTLRQSDIAGMLGFNSANYFTRTFTKCFGLTPTAYRNRHL